MKSPSCGDLSVIERACFLIMHLIKTQKQPIIFEVEGDNIGTHLSAAFSSALVNFLPFTFLFKIFMFQCS